MVYSRRGVDETVGSARIGPRMTLSQPMIVVSRTTGVLLGVVTAGLVVVGAGRVVAFFSLAGATDAPCVLGTATVSGAAITAGVEEADAAASESAFDPPPG